MTLTTEQREAVDKLSKEEVSWLFQLGMSIDLMPEVRDGSPALYEAVQLLCVDPIRCAFGYSRKKAQEGEQGCGAAKGSKGL